MSAVVLRMVVQAGTATLSFVKPAWVCMGSQATAEYLTRASCPGRSAL